MVVRQKSFGLRTVLERVEQHGLADAAQPANDHALLGRAALQTANQDPELLELLIAPGERLRARPGVRRVRVIDRIHCLRGYSRL